MSFHRKTVEFGGMAHATAHSVPSTRCRTGSSFPPVRSSPSQASRRSTKRTHQRYSPGFTLIPQDGPDAWLCVLATCGVNGIEIVYTAGFGPAANNVPADLRIAISQIASHWYENREIMTFDIAARDVPQSAERIIKSRKVLKV